MTKIFRGNSRQFKQLTAEMNFSPNALDLLGRYARIAHMRDTRRCRKKLYHDILTLFRTQTKTNPTYYRLACLKEDYAEAKQGLMAVIHEKENEGRNPWVDRLLLCMYMIKQEGVSRGVEDIAKRVLLSDNVKILVGDEVEILELGDLKIGEVAYECSSVLRSASKRENNAVKAYKAGHGNGNDIAYLSMMWME